MFGHASPVTPQQKYNHIEIHKIQINVHYSDNWPPPNGSPLELSRSGCKEIVVLCPYRRWVVVFDKRGELELGLLPVR